MCARARGRSHPRLPRASPAGRGRRCCRPLDPPRASALPAEKPARLRLLRGGNRWRPRLRERPPTGRGRPTDRDVIEVVPRQDGIPLELLDWGSRLSITASRCSRSRLSSPIGSSARSDAGGARPCEVDPPNTSTTTTRSSSRLNERIVTSGKTRNVTSLAASPPSAHASNTHPLKRSRTAERSILPGRLNATVTCSPRCATPHAFLSGHSSTTRSTSPRSPASTSTCDAASLLGATAHRAAQRGAGCGVACRRANRAARAAAGPG
jgi:hypothetical protein